jgi:hypothetical protein
MSQRIYVAIPYTNVEELSFKMANRASYELIKLGHIPLSPISMSHPIVEQSKTDENYTDELLGTWEVWSTIDYSFIDWCDEIWVVEMSKDAIQGSIGVKAELEYAKKLGKAVRTIKVNYTGEGEDLNWTFKFPRVKYFKSNARLHAEKIADIVLECESRLDAVEAVEDILS